MRKTTRDVVEGLSRREVLLGGVVVVAAVACDRSPGPAGQSTPSAEATPGEPPMLAQRVADGDLPPLAERLPDQPVVVEPVDEAGVYGGTWQMAMLGAADDNWMLKTIGYDFLVRWDAGWTEALPNVAESVQVSEDGRTYTIKLRAGMKWSDGSPYTTDDLLFYYEDVLSNEDIRPNWGGRWTGEGGEPPVLERIDDQRLTITLAGPSGLLLDVLAGPGGRWMQGWPRHYLEEFHASYNPDADQLAKDAGFPSWVELFTAKSNNWTNPDLPTLNAWMVTVGLGEGTRVAAERNPYYWKVDSAGQQLPYIDEVVYDIIADEEAILLRFANGELDMDVRHINSLTNKPVLAQNRDAGNYDFFDAIDSAMNAAVIALNLTHGDETLREIFQNKDFRIGLSHAINREEIIDVALQGQGRPWQAAPRPEFEFHDMELGTQYTEYDVDLAGELLDRAGYAERDGDGFRLGADGERIRFAIDVSGPTAHWVDVVDLVSRYWREVGIDVRVSNMERSLLFERARGNEHDAVVWGGSGGMREGLLAPDWYMPNGSNSWFAILWGAWYQGQEPNEEPPEPAKRQMELNDQLNAAVSIDGLAEPYRQILQIAKEEFWVIGIALPEGGYGVLNNRVKNVPRSMPNGFDYPTPGPTHPEQYFISESG